MKITRTNKVLLTLGSLGVAATIAGAGTFATFTDTGQATQQITAGTVELTLGATSFATPIADLAPGDTVQKRFTLTNVGSLDFDNISLSTTDDAAGANVHLFDGSPAATDALQVKIERCDDADGWEPSGGVLVCENAPIFVLTERTATGISSVELTGLALAEDGTNDVVATYRLPASADNAVQGDSGALNYTFVATQRDATNS